MNSRYKRKARIEEIKAMSEERWTEDTIRRCHCPECKGEVKEEDKESSGYSPCPLQMKSLKGYSPETPCPKESFGYKDNLRKERAGIAITNASWLSSRRNLLRQFRESSAQEFTENLPGHRPRTPIAGKKKPASVKSTLLSK